MSLGMRIGSLFSGIGGLELGLEMAGLGETVWQVEREPFCRIVLAKHWPHAERFDDVCSVGKANLAPVDLICGGFPCQDVSSAGKGAGLAGDRSGLWREYARIVDELRPAWCVVENVVGGALRWVDAIVSELDALGYACLPCPVSARDVGAPHIRQRVFVVAHDHRVRELQPQGSEREQRGWAAHGAAAGQPQSEGRAASASDDDSGELRHAQRDARWRDRVCDEGVSELGDNGEARNAYPPPDTSDALHPGRQGTGPGEQEQRRPRLAGHTGWSSEPGVVPLVHGLSGGMAGRRRRARIRALGNTVVPQSAEVAGWVIRELLARSSSTPSSAANRVGVGS